MVLNNSFSVEPSPRGVRIRHEIQVSGPVAPLVRVLLKRLYTRLLAKETRRLVELATARRAAAAISR
jgi:hypothetical protein